MTADELVVPKNLQRFYALIQEYKKNIRWQNVTISEVHMPPEEEYGVVYEVVFEPAELDSARLEFWFTETGGVAVGVETRERIGRRLHRKFYENNNLASSLMFHQPISVTHQYVEKWIELCADGRVFLQIRVGWFGIRNAQVALKQSDYEILLGESYNPLLRKYIRRADNGLPFGSWIQLPFRSWC